jgi:hypothetical protein
MKYICLQISFSADTDVKNISYKLYNKRRCCCTYPGVQLSASSMIFLIGAGSVFDWSFDEYGASLEHSSHKYITAQQAHDAECR